MLKPFEGVSKGKPQMNKFENFLIFWLIVSFIYSILSSERHTTSWGQKVSGIGWVIKFLLIGIGGVIFFVFIGGAFGIF
jgi:hypothetical protein